MKFYDQDPELKKMATFINQHPPAKVYGFDHENKEFYVMSVFTKKEEDGTVSSFTRTEKVRAHRNAVLAFLGY